MKHNRFQKMLAVLLALFMISMSLPVFSLAIDVYAESESDNEPENPTQITETVTEEKIPFEIAEDAEFDTDEISVVIFKEYSHETFNIGFFSGYIPEGIELKEVYFVNSINQNDEDFNAMLFLRIENTTAEKVISFAQSIYSHPKVKSVDLDYILDICLDEPTDPGYTSQKSIYEFINAIDAWESLDNLQEVTVAVIDKGVENHVDLADNIDRSLEWDFSHNEKDTSNDIYTSHGTHVSGIIGAVWNNSYIAGINDYVKIVPFQITSADDFYDAMKKCEEYGIDIVNFSMGSDTYFDNLRIGIEKFSGIFICAAGNESMNLNNGNYYYPSSLDLPNMISVGACNETLTGKRENSNYGSYFVDIMAPGSNIYSTVGENSCDYKSGTSMAAPFVTGAAALLKSAYPNATNKQIIDALEYGCNSSEEWMTTYSKYGCLDIKKSLDLLSLMILQDESIEDGTYQILVGENQTNALSINIEEENADFELSVEESNSSDKSQLFYIFNYMSGYRLTNMYSGNTLGLTANYSSITNENIELGDDEQKWMFAGVVETEAGYSTKIVSYRTGEYLKYSSGSFTTVDTVDESCDFLLKRKDGMGNLAYGEIVSASDSIKDVSIDNKNRAVLSSISANGRTTLLFNENDGGLWTITDRTTGKVLSSVGSSAIFNPALNSVAQKWFINKLGGNRFSIINASSGKALTNNNGDLKTTYYTVSVATQFDIYTKGDVTLDYNINLKDVLIARKFLSNKVELSDEQIYCGDLDCDGIITTVDVEQMRRYVGGLTNVIIIEPTDDNIVNGTATSLSSTSVSASILNSAESDYLSMTDEEYIEHFFGNANTDTLGITIFD